MKSFIYKLIDPRDNQIRYIGKTNQSSINRRLTGHIRSSIIRNRTKKEKWINSLIKMELKPIIQVIEECDHSIWEQREIYWIDFYKNENLTNLTEGGEGVKDNQGEKNGMYGKRHKDTSKTKMRERANLRTGIKNSRARKIYQFDISGCFVKEWLYCKEVADFYNLSRGNLSAAASHNTRYVYSEDKFLKILGGFIFSFIYVDRIENVNIHVNAKRFIL